MLHELPAVVQKKKRVGRGIARTGAKSGRGQKGQKSRAGYSKKRGFEGGQTPIYMRFPKFRGAKQKFPRQGAKPASVTLAQLNVFDSGSIVGVGKLLEKKLIGKSDKEVKIIGGGKMEKKLTLRVHAATPSARKQVEAAGGKIEIIEK